jgi:hypothetical protein
MHDAARCAAAVRYLGAWKLARENSSNESMPSLLASSWSKMRRAGLSAAPALLLAAPLVEPVAPAAPVADDDPPVDDAPVDDPVAPVDVPVEPVPVDVPDVPVPVDVPDVPVPVDVPDVPMPVELPNVPVPVDVPLVPVEEVPPVDDAPLLPGVVADVPVDEDGSVPVDPDVDCARTRELPAKSAVASAPVRSVRWKV